jgi:hypothetical protein
MRGVWQRHRAIRDETLDLPRSPRRSAERLARSGYPRASGSTKNAIAAYCSAAAAITSTWKTSW